MGMRFRRSVKICPGVRLNFSKSGVSTTIGGRGFSVTKSARGTYLNTGIPGTGISMREKISGGSKQKTSNAKQGESGNVAAYENDIAYRAGLVNSFVDELNNVSLLTPEVDDFIGYQIQPFSEPKPQPAHNFGALQYFMIAAMFLLGTVLLSIVGGIAAAIITAIICQIRCNKADAAQNAKVHEEWTARRDAYMEAETKKQAEIQAIFDNNVAEPEKAFEQGLEFINWPYETNISYEIDGDTIKIDVDLPEIEEIENHKVVVKGRGANKRVEQVEKSAKQTRQAYASHIHGIGMVLAGIAFNVLDAVNTVIISAYSQRLSPATGNVEDEYLYSVKIPRQGWLKVNLANKANIDPIALLGSFEIRRSMTATGIFKAIAPIEEGKVTEGATVEGHILDGRKWAEEKAGSYVRDAQQS